MPNRLPHACHHPGCPAVTRESYCPVHKRQTQQAQDRQRGSAAERGYDSRWAKARLRYLREHPLCAECERRGRIVAANEVDHIIPHRGNPALFHDETNWQGLCNSCHSRKTAKESRWGQMPATLAVTIVCGPPGSGKTSYVRERARRGDLIVDLDALFVALSGRDWYDKPDELLPFAAAARDAVIDRLQRGGVQRAWIIMGGARRSERAALAARLKAQVTVLPVDANECLRRIQDDARRAARWQQWEPLVRRWWREYES